MSDSVRPHRRNPPRLLCPWDSPGKNTGVGCHFLLQCMKVKSESEVAQSCLTLSDSMDCSLPGSSFHGISQARVLEWGAIACRTLQVKWSVLYKSESEVNQSYPTLCDPMDCSLPGSSIQGIFQARVLEWGAIGTRIPQTTWCSHKIIKVKSHSLSENSHKNSQKYIYEED